MARRAVELLNAQMDEAFALIRGRVEGLTDAEMFCEPVAGCWTVRRGPNGRWAADYPELPHPDPAPFTTIAWRLVHVAESKLMYHEYAFGQAKLTFPDVDSAHTAASAIAQLEEGEALLKTDLATLDDRGLDREVMTNWGEPWPAWRIFTTMITTIFITAERLARCAICIATGDGCGPCETRTRETISATPTEYATRGTMSASLYRAKSRRHRSVDVQNTRQTLRSAAGCAIEHMCDLVRTSDVAPGVGC